MLYYIIAGAALLLIGFLALGYLKAPPDTAFITKSWNGNSKVRSVLCTCRCNRFYCI